MFTEVRGCTETAKKGSEEEAGFSDLQGHSLVWGKGRREVHRLRTTLEMGKMRTVPSPYPPV